MQERESATLCSRLTRAGFVFGTASAALATLSTLYALMIGGFPYYDPLLLRIYGIGMLLSCVGILFALTGLWRRSNLRWHGIVLPTSMLLLWVLWASSE